MNLNDFVVLPNNKARSVKLNARNLQELQMETAILANESREIEEKLQQLKDSMSKEKAERGHSQRFQWASGQFLKSNSLSNGSKKDKESKLQKLSAGKLKIRVLKAEELTAPPQPPPPPPLLTQMARKNRLRGRICGQCEVKTAGIMCAECTENYCVGCFARFHQKGALKFHKMIPTQAELQTHVSARDVVSCFQKQIDPGSCSSTFTTPNPNPNPSTTPSSNHILMCNAITGQGGESPEKGRVAEENPDCSKVLAVSHGEEKKVDITGPPSSLLRGEYSEEESARSFQEALKLWRGKKNDGFWIPVRPVSVSAKATQTALPPDREAEGQRRGGGEERVPVMVEFTENSLTYMDRLLLKKHRRTPFEMYQPSQAFSSDLKSLPATRAEEETASILNEEEEDFRHYCASLFAVPVSRDRPEPQVTTPESCLCIEVLEETGRDMRGVSAEKRADNSIEVPSVQRISKKGRSLVPRTALPSDGSLGVISLSPGATQPFKQFRAPLQPKLAQKLNSSKCQTSQAGSSVKSFPSKSKLSTCPTAENLTATESSIKTSPSKSPPIFSRTVYQSVAGCGSPQRTSLLPHSQIKIPKSSHSTPLYSADVLAMTSNRSPITEEHLSLSPPISFSLRSTFTVSSSSSTESTLLPKVNHPAPLEKCPDSALLPDQPQSSQLFVEPISSPKICESPRSNLMSPKESQHSLCDPESLQSDNQLQLPLSPETASTHSPAKHLEPALSQISVVPSETLSKLSLFDVTPPDEHSTYRSTRAFEDAPNWSILKWVENESTQSHQDTNYIPSSSLLNVIQNTPFAVKMDEDETLSVDSGDDDMSSDSLGMASQEEDTSDEDTQMQGPLMRGRSREEQENPAISHLEDSFVRAEAETKKDLQTDKSEQLPELSTVIHNKSSGSGSEQFCDLDGFLPPGLDMIAGQPETPEHAHCDPLHTCQSPLRDSDPTGSEGYRLSSRLGAFKKEHLVSRMMKGNHRQPTGIQIHSSRTREVSANELGTSVDSEFSPAFPPLSQAAKDIMEICNVDQMGCEDPDLEIDTTAHALSSLDQELKLMAKGTQALVAGTGNGGCQDQCGNPCVIRGGDANEQEEEEVKTDRQSVLLLP
ncbi:uncharacterized protein zbbx isoform X2 [Archocentrus centrarchus]|uniref:uncharacterized protein zbbx isoform X2 n=1 Tax=Archocentrus centrarchus TaxID=63155 RepID=UPI0011EA4835|nr:zinc finger B-box domain-containing protein 1 isoform X2 [Archocentrus centrarchus]